MKARTWAPWAKFATAAILVILGGTWMAPPAAWAQLSGSPGGSLIVTITAPTSGSTVTGTITVSASVSTIGSAIVSNVQFKVDGANLGAPVTTAPYSTPWDTRTATNASHTLTAGARDALGIEYTSDPVTVTVFNDKTPPTVAITSPTSGAVVTGTVTVTAAAADNVGVAGVQFLVDGTKLGAELTSSPYSVPWDTTTVADGSHALTAVARDAAGNTTTSVAVPVQVSQTATRFESEEPSIMYTDGTTAPGQPAGWWHGSRSRTWSNRTASFNRSAGARATFTFTGTTVRWIGFRAPWAGIGRVYVDGTFVVEIDLYDPAEHTQAVIYTASGLTPGSHTIAVESTGLKNNAASDYAVVVDAFDVLPAPQPPVWGTRFEETAASYSGPWKQGDTSKPSWTGGTAAVSSGVGAQASFSFTGTELRWMGLRGPANGIAQVILDGAFHAHVDTYSPVEVQGMVYLTTSLAPGHHTVTIVASGDKNAAATGSAIVIDAFDVRTRFEEMDASVTYTSDWMHENAARAYSGTSPNLGAGTAALSRTAGGRATFSFTGTGASWIGYSSPSTGIANVYVDGALVATVDTYSATEQVQATLFSVTGLSDGRHTLAIEPTGQHNAASNDSLVFVDAFDATLSSSAPVITRFQEGDSSIAYTSGWTKGNLFDLWTGEFAELASAAGSRATFSFTGTGVRWIGQTAFNGGIAHVYLDGVQLPDVDTLASMQEQFQQSMFSVSGLASGPHTVAIEATGTSSPGSQGTMIVVDAFDVW